MPRSHIAGSRSSTHHWLWSTFCTREPLGLSTSLESCHHEKYRLHCPEDPLTDQNLQSIERQQCYGFQTMHSHLKVFVNFERKGTLQTSSSETNTFLAATSLCTYDLWARYVIPDATCRQKLRRSAGRFTGATASELNDVTYRRLVGHNQYVEMSST